MQTVILSFDSFASNCIGCYGNEWVETPHWDRLASTGVVFDRHFATALGTNAGSSWATDSRTSQPQSTEFVPVGKFLRASGVDTHLIMANHQMRWQDRLEFDLVTMVQGDLGFHAQPTEVPIAKLVKAGLSAWNENPVASRSRLMWLHAPSPGLPPEGFESLYVDDFEERGQLISELTEVERMRHPSVYAGSVSLIDYWLGELIAGVETSGYREPTLFIVTAAQGDLWQSITASQESNPHSADQNQMITDQLIRAPLVFKIIGDDRYREFAGVRSGRLVQTWDLLPTLFDWFCPAFAARSDAFASRSWLRELTEVSVPRDFLWINSDGRFDAIRTEDWLCVRDKMVRGHRDGFSDEGISSASLYRKPEDIWDVNSVTSQHVDVVRELLRRFPEA